MAKEREANLARDQYSEDLRKMGAHAIAVDKVKRKGADTFAVVAFFEKNPAEAPETLDVKQGKRLLHVPLVVRVQETFKPE